MTWRGKVFFIFFHVFLWLDVPTGWVPENGVKGKMVIFLNFTSAKWVVASACNKGTLSGIFVGLATLIDLQDLLHNTKYINKLMPHSQVPTALMVWNLNFSWWRFTSFALKITTGAPEKCGGHCDCQRGWMVCGSIGILCQLSAAWQMSYVGSEVNLVGEKTIFQPRKSLCENFKMIR